MHPDGTQLRPVLSESGESIQCGRCAADSACNSAGTAETTPRSRAGAERARIVEQALMYNDRARRGSSHGSNGTAAVGRCVHLSNVHCGAAAGARTDVYN